MGDERRLVGAVLAGGRSRRMGTTKALVRVDGRMMAERVIQALRAAGCDPVVLMGGDPDELRVLATPVWPDRERDAGPVGAVAEVLRRTSLEHPAARAVVIAACDLPWLDAATLTALVESLGRSPDADVCVARTDRLEPLCAVWRPEAADAVDASLRGGTRAMHRLIGGLAAVTVDVARRTLHNVNAPHDLPGGDLSGGDRPGDDLPVDPAG